MFTKTTILLLTIACMCLGVVSECAPPLKLLGTRTLDLSNFGEFEYFNELAADGELSHAVIRHEDDGRYTFHAWKSIGSSWGRNTTELPVRDLSSQEIDQLKNVFTSVVIETYNHIPLTTDVILNYSFRWDSLTIDQWMGKEQLGDGSPSAIGELLDGLAAGTA